MPQADVALPLLPEKNPANGGKQAGEMYIYFVVISKECTEILMLSNFCKQNFDVQIFS